MGTTNLNVTYRPIRIGFLIHEGDIDGLVTAATINSLLWGGINNPMISIGNDKNHVKELIELYNVDAVFPINDSIDLDKLFDKYSPIRNSHFMRHMNFLDKDWQVSGKTRNYLDIINIINHIWNTRIHAWPSDKKSSYIKVSWNPEDADAKIFPILFGAFPQSNSIYEQDFFEGLHSDTIEIQPSLDVPASINDKKPLIQLTSYQLQIGYQGRHGSRIYVGNGSSFEDLIRYWNLRAAGVPIQFYNYDNPKRWSRYIRGYLEKLKREIQGRNIDKKVGQIGVLLCHYNIEGIDVEEVRKSLDIDLIFKSHSLKNPKYLPVKPIIHYLQERTVLANVEEKYSKYAISCELPPLSFLDQNDEMSRLQKFVALFSSFWEAVYPLHTIKVPSLRELLMDFGRDIIIDPSDATIQGNRIGSVISSLRSSQDLYPISYDVLVERILSHVSIKSEPSQAGILAKTLSDQLGGLEGVRVLKIRGVRKLIKAHGVNKNFHINTALNYINDSGNIRRFKNLHIKGKAVTARVAFNILLEKGLIREGLELRCAKCRLSNWLPVNRIDESWSCEYCGEKQPIATLLTGSAGEWRYRRSGLFGKDNHQEGAIPVLLTLLQFNRLFRHPGFVYSTGFNLTGNNINCETDLCILQYERHEQSSWNLQSKLEIGIGECKDEGGLIDDNDVQKLMEVYRCLDSKDIRCYLIFSKAADNFSDQEISLFKALNKDRIPLILFTNTELEPYYPYEKLPKNNIVTTANTLQEMSWVSSSTYLK